jgi:hypothetical protein
MFEVTRDDAIRAGVIALAAWHKREHGDRCACRESQHFGYQVAVVVDALIARGVEIEL